MHKKAIGLTILSFVLLLSLSGCFSYRFAVQHHPDGSGLLTIESILSQDFLSMFSGDPAMEDAHSDILVESTFSADDLRDDPNIRSITEDEYTDPQTGALHHILHIEVIDILKPLYLAQEEGDDTLIFQVSDNGDGTYRFTAILASPSDFTLGNDEMGADMPMDPQSFRFFLQDSTITWQLSVDELVAADPLAAFDPANQAVTWEIPITDVLFGIEDLEIYAIYRLEQIEPLSEPEPQETATPEPNPTEALKPTPTEINIRPPVDLDVEQPGFLGLPNWVPLVLVSLLCLGMFFVVIVAVVILLVVRNRKVNHNDTP